MRVLCLFLRSNTQLLCLSHAERERNCDDNNDDGDDDDEGDQIKFLFFNCFLLNSQLSLALFSRLHHQ